MTNVLYITNVLLNLTIILCLIVIALSILLLLFRIITGPTNPDRAVALDALGVNLMSITALMAIILATAKLNDVILLIGIVFFVGTIAIAKYIEKGVIIDRDME